MRALFLTVTSAFLFFSAPASGQDKLTVLLDWFINPDHGPLIVAQERGYFEAIGLDVTMVEPADPSAPPKLVAAGQADLAVSYQPQLHVQVSEGLPLVRVGTLVATPLNSLVVLADGPIQRIADLKGKKVGYSVGGFEEIVLGAMLRRHGLALNDVELVNVNFSLSPSLITGHVDAVIGAFRNFELNQMNIVGHPGAAFFPEEEGVPPYDELILVAHRDSADSQVIRRFLDALEAATIWTINHPGAAWDLFRQTDKKLDDELNKRAWIDTLPRLALRPAALDTRRYERFAKFMLENGMISETIPVPLYAVEVTGE